MITPSFLTARDGSGICVQCVLNAGGDLHCATADDGVAHLQTHAQMGHVVDDHVLQYLERLKKEDQMVAARRRSRGETV